MELLDVMLKRRSIRRYTGESVPEEKLRRILDAGLLSFSSRNFDPWEFIVVKNKDALRSLSKCKAVGSAMLAEADCAIVVIGDGEKADVWVEDCSIAMTYMHMMAAEQGVGSCWIQCRLRQTSDGESSEQYVKNLLDIPEKYGVEAILSLGIAEQEREPKNIDDIDLTKIHQEKY
jgi:nitroreductase